jgi:hypothetical protein
VHACLCAWTEKQLEKRGRTLDEPVTYREV